MSDQLLLQRIKDGDNSAFRELYDENASAIYKYILVRVNEPQLAEDLLSEVFVKAWNGLPSFQWQGKPLRAWLFRIAHNQIVDTHRRTKETYELDPRRDSYFDSQFGRIEDQSEIQEAFNALTKEEQTILYLRFFEGYNLVEIAELIGKSPNAARVAQFRALKRLRATI